MSEPTDSKDPKGMKVLAAFIIFVVAVLVIYLLPENVYHLRGIVSAIDGEKSDTVVVIRQAWAMFISLLIFLGFLSILRKQ